MPSPQLIAHPRPIIDLPSIEAWTYIDPTFGSGWEKLFVSRNDNASWQLCNIPFFSYGLLAGSVLRIDGEGRIHEVVRQPPAQARRLLFKDAGCRERFLPLVEGHLAEISSDRLLAVQVHDRRMKAFDALVSKWLADGDLVDVDDVMASSFEAGPESSEPAEEGDGNDGPRVWTPGDAAPRPLLADALT